VRLWREKRGEAESEDLSGDLLVQLGTVTEHLNGHFGQVVAEAQRQVFQAVPPPASAKATQSFPD
jgi:hypothetical protein